MEPDWRAVPHAELDATEDKFLMLDERGEWLDTSADAQLKRARLAEDISLPLFETR